MINKECPFCRVLLPAEPEQWQEVGCDFFGEPAKIGEVESCADCALIPESHEQIDELLALLPATQAQ